MDGDQALPVDEPAAESSTTPSDDGRRRRRRRWLLVIAPIVPVGVAIAGFMIALNRTPPAPELTDAIEINIDEVSTARLEALVANARDDPQFAEEFPGLLLLLAERHFISANYDRAFESYAELIEHAGTRPAQFAVSLARIAWIAWRSTGDTEAALDTVDRSLGVDPANAETMYIKGQILWCGRGDTDGAIALFESVMQAPDLPDEVTTQVASDLQAATAGEACR